MMKLALLVVVLGLASAVPTNRIESLSAQFESWKLEHGKVYSSAEEHHYRFLVFQENLKVIDKHNSEGHSWTMGVNQFADMTPKEFQALQTLLPSTLGTEESTAHRRYVRSNSTNPSSIDWRTQGVVTDIKNQASCGSCWAFSTVVSLEGQVAIKSGKLTSFSEQDLVDCVKDVSIEGGSCCDGCQGGLMDAAFQYMVDKQNGYDNTESSYPYTGTDGSCAFNPSATAGVPITGFTDIAQGDENSLIDAVANVGPVSVAVNANMFWQFYSGGIFSPLFCDKSGLNHGVAVVGYGDGYLIIRNSWGGNWGEKGYMRMKSGHNVCGVAQSASYPNV